MAGGVKFGGCENVSQRVVIGQYSEGTTVQIITKLFSNGYFNARNSHL